MQGAPAEGEGRSPDLRNPRLKIVRAKEHLDALDAELRTFYDSGACVMTTEAYPDQEAYVLRLRMKPPPPRLGLLAGDVFYCLRSALDQLAWQLALLTTDDPYRLTEFPVFSVDNADTQQQIRRATQDIPPLAVEQIKLLQPYHSGEAYKDDPLWQLNRLCNIDKHRLIPVHSMFAEFHVPVVPGLSPQRLTNGDFIIVLPPSMKEQMERAPRPRAGVAFGSQSEGVAIDPEGLSRICKHVQENVIPRFVPFLPDIAGVRQDSDQAAATEAAHNKDGKQQC